MKQRLVGAVVLVSLAVIFIPMLLDGGEEGGMPLFGTNIPDKPDYQFEPLDIPLEPVPRIPAERPQLVERPEPQAGTQAETSTQPAESPAPIEPPAAEKPVAKPAPEPAPVAQSSQGDAWVVQVGSFSSSDNALGLRDRLRGAGFVAFVEKVKSEDQTVYRVRIGPELKREEADAQLLRLQQKLKLEGIVMGYHP